ncbi:MAG: molybdenum cofactor guanylyltransferase [Candidatus Marinimicrobia bacterium]|nr:molybdenum cofactor guanylyltransferase [Candidatus Neomarinimicrobiota bacterium]MDP6853677.1 molybdenum cofactor guanylyltransferase [Candidatus Neomarinimicrobiota bacterium]MDP6937027.1 molybdenum cofactor guanylyltransferase [Candidatus Neomarinimicrobiota bacterium]
MAAEKYQSVVMDKDPQINAYILTGGKSRRFGSTKALAEIHGMTFIDKIHNVIAPHFKEVYSVGKKKFSSLMNNIPDKYEKQTPIIGLISAMHHSHTNWNFILSVDIPFISTQVIMQLKQAIHNNPSADIIIPQVKKQLMPLTAMYHKRNLPAIERTFIEGNLSLMSIVHSLKSTILKMDEFENELANINTVEAFESQLAKQTNTQIVEES